MAYAFGQQALEAGGNRQRRLLRRFGVAVPLAGRTAAGQGGLQVHFDHCLVSLPSRRTQRQKEHQRGGEPRGHLARRSAGVAPCRALLLAT